MSHGDPDDEKVYRASEVSAEASATIATSETMTRASESSGDVGPLLVTGMASGGEGVGRLEDGRVVFVEGGVPGDLVELAQLATKKKVARAGIGRLIEPSPDRVEPRCPHFGQCGGCRWQHVRYEAQLDAKRLMVSNALERIGGFTSLPDIEIKASPDPYGYRARARLVESNGGLGYRIRGSREVEKIESCPVLASAAQDALSRLMDSVSKAGREQIDAKPETSKRKRRAVTEWIVSAGAIGPAIVHEVRGRKESPDSQQSVTIEVLGESLRASSSSFMQGNALLWDALADEVCRQCLFDANADAEPAPKASEIERTSSRRFVELYAGIGFLTIPLARRGLSGVAIESDQSALADLAFNLKKGGLAKQVEIVRGRVESRRDLAKRLSAADLLVVDPPRIGLERIVRDVIASDGPSRVVYVSCDPATLARDLRVFAAAGYALSSVRAMDLFPQTPHVEIIVRLDRPSRSGRPKRPERPGRPKRPER